MFFARGPLVQDLDFAFSLSTANYLERENLVLIKFEFKVEQHPELLNLFSCWPLLMTTWLLGYTKTLHHLGISGVACHAA